MFRIILSDRKCTAMRVRYSKRKNKATNYKRGKKMVATNMSHKLDCSNNNVPIINYPQQSIVSLLAPAISSSLHWEFLHSSISRPDSLLFILAYIHAHFLFLDQTPSFSSSHTCTLPFSISQNLRFKFPKDKPLK